MIVTALPPDGDLAVHLWQPRVSPKVGVGVPFFRVPSLVDAITAAAPHSAGTNPWSAPGIDHTERFAYIQGPVGALVPVTGYQPIPQFVVSRYDLFGLGRRLAVLNGRL